MKKYVLLISCILLGLWSCRSGQTDKSLVEKTSEIEVVELPKGFDSFYKKFHADTVFQVSRIVFPLDNNTTDLEVGAKWTEENWRAHRPFDDHGGTFRRSFQPIGTMVVEKIAEANGLFYMERRYAVLSDEWHLIYYEVSVPTFGE